MIPENGPGELADLSAAVNVILHAHDQNLINVERRVEERTVALDRTNRALTEALLAAQAANQARDDFIANISHEIRTPMTAILGFADLLMEDGDASLAPARRLEGIGTIRRNANQLLTTINDLLDISTLAAGRVVFHRRDTDPREVLREVWEAMLPKAQAKRLEIKIDMSAPLPMRIVTDGTRLRQILMNLVGNAIKFTAKGSVLVRPRMATGRQGEPLLSIGVEDTGVGIGAEQLGRLFQPFGQVDSSSTREHGGLGMGLAIAQRLARAMGGDIEVTSQVGRGSRFVVTVATGPVASSDLVVREPLVAGPARSGDEPVVHVQLPFRILLVEDGQDNQRLVSFHLRRAGATVEVAENGQVGVQKALGSLMNGTPFDLILMDMQMPVMDGYAATSQLRSQGWKRPVLALTAHAMAGDRERCLGAGCNDYLTKPVDVAQLLAACRKWAESACRVG